jgi:hypothetical protein
MAIKRYTAEQVRKMKPLIDYVEVKDEDINLTDPDAPDIADLFEKGLLARVERPYKLDSEKSATIRALSVGQKGKLNKKYRIVLLRWLKRLDKKS